MFLQHIMEFARKMMYLFCWNRYISSCTKQHTLLWATHKQVRYLFLFQKIHKIVDWDSWPLELGPLRMLKVSGTTMQWSAVPYYIITNTGCYLKDRGHGLWFPVLIIWRMRSNYAHHSEWVQSEVTVNQRERGSQQRCLTTI